MHTHSQTAKENDTPLPRREHAPFFGLANVTYRKRFISLRTTSCPTESEAVRLSIPPVQI